MLILFHFPVYLRVYISKSPLFIPNRSLAHNNLMTDLGLYICHACQTVCLLLFATLSQVNLLKRKNPGQLNVAQELTKCYLVKDKVNE